MKLSLLLLTAFAGCAVAASIVDVPEARDVALEAELYERELASADTGLFSREAEGVDMELDAELFGRDNEAKEANAPNAQNSQNQGNSQNQAAPKAQNPSAPQSQNPASPQREDPAAPPRQCPTRRQATPFIRRGSFPFRTTRIIGFFFSTRRFNTVPLFFLFHPRTNDFFYTTNVAERNNAIRNLGYQNRGVAGFIFFNQRCGGSPLFRMFNPRRGQHFYTTSPAERANAKRLGWNDEGVTGFIFRF
ncbi:hypothetical protein LshimejAT787_1204830 [Lyophyllum shimeji]|uniref:DUF5648 domain-containing protein n=1 Tax=Lyophyllum shimeji TaxID=47721 RepID=A0A9P3PWZ5_LYOSH|nr:hypothetical protein LshimejAT787_1204830 [Lyophyllum shimeji]